MMNYPVEFIKLGSGVVADENGTIREDNLKLVTDYVAEVYDTGSMLSIVTSGAISVGKGVLNERTEHGYIPGINGVNEQTLSALGQPVLHEAFSDLLREHHLTAGQLLITTADMKNKKSRRNIMNVFRNHLQFGVIPIFNENDATSVREFLTDNDILAGKLAIAASAQSIIFVTEKVDGLHNESGYVVREILPKQQRTYRMIVRDERNKFSRGGMKSKYATGAKVANAGIDALIMGERDLGSLSSSFTGAYGTHFVAKK